MKNKDIKKMQNITFLSHNNLQVLTSLKSVNLSSIKNFTFDSQILEGSLIYDQDIFKSIKQEYLNVDEVFDSSRFELCRVPRSFKKKDITAHCEQLIREHYVVSRKVLLLVLENQPNFKEELHNIINIERCLLETSVICKTCRDYLNLTIHQITSSSLQILHFYSKRKLLKHLLKILVSLKSLYRMKISLQHFVNKENYPQVISLVSECKKVSETFKEYQCVIQLYCNLNEILDQVEENLDLSILKICINFDVDKYASTQIAYNFLGKSQAAVDQLHMHFTAAISNAACNTVLRYVKNSAKQQYNCLCRLVNLDDFLPCLIALCGELLSILKNYYLIMKWHENYKQDTESEERKLRISYANEEYVKQKLKNGIVKICSDMEKKLVIYLDEFDLLSLKYEEFIQVLNVIDRILKIIRKLCEINMIKVYEYLRQKFLEYFKFYHASRLDELRIFLENDGWKLCPIKSTFQITQLQEFKTFKYIFNAPQSNNIYENFSEFEYAESYDIIQNCIEDYVTFSSNLTLNEYIDEEILRSSEETQQRDLSDISDDDEIPEALKHDYVGESTDGNINKKRKWKSSGPIITNTTLSVLRICGKYLQVTRFFKEVSEIVLENMIQIFELYFYTVYNFFATDVINNEFCTIVSTKLKRSLSRMRGNLIIDIQDMKDSMEISHSSSKISQPNLSSIINLNDPDKLFGLAERIVAVESLVFLGQQYDSFKNYLNSLMIHDHEAAHLNQFYNQSIALTTDLRCPVYMAVVFKNFNANDILTLMSKVNWELKEVISQHNDYIDILIKGILAFKLKLSEIYTYIPISKEVNNTIWNNVTFLITRIFVEGFSHTKKCSNGGRALMQLDFIQYVSKYETITSQRPMPYQEYVASYIKAYYLPESSIESWIKIHSEYTPKQLIGLISCMDQSRRLKQKLINIIEDKRLNR